MHTHQLIKQRTTTWITLSGSQMPSDVLYQVAETIATDRFGYTTRAALYIVARHLLKEVDYAIELRDWAASLISKVVDDIYYKRTTNQTDKAIQVQLAQEAGNLGTNANVFAQECLFLSHFTIRLLEVRMGHKRALN